MCDDAIYLSKDFITEISDAGEVYLIGGALRNILHNKLFGTKLLIKDRDLLVRKLQLFELIKYLKKYGNAKEVGKRFGVIKFTLEISGNILEFDIALPRIESSIGSGYKNFKIICDHNLSLEDDLKRRDATINAMAFRIYNCNDTINEKFEISDISNIIDPLNGINDLKNKIWRAIGDPHKSFIDDHTRIMRALRQCAELELKLENKTENSIVTNHHLLNEILSESIVRITEELVRMLENNFHNIIGFLFTSGIARLLKIPKNGLNNIIKCTSNNSNLRIKVACLLSANNNKHAINWTKQFELSAALHYSKNDVLFIKCVSLFYKSIEDIYKNNTNIQEFMLRKLIQNTEKLCPNYGVEYTYDLIRYFDIVSGECTEMLIKLYINNKNIIVSPAQIKLDGITIMSLYNLTGIRIKILKLELFNQITAGNVENNRDDLINFTNINLQHLFK